MVEQVKKSDSYDFCVVDHAKKLLGTISIGDFRDVLLEQEVDLNVLIFAKDIAVPPSRVIIADRPLKEAIDIFRRKDLDFLPVIKDEATREFVGLIHYRDVMDRVNKELLDRRGSG
jgi:CBS domain-containing protein